MELVAAIALITVSAIVVLGLQQRSHDARMTALQDLFVKTVDRHEDERQRLIGWLKTPEIQSTIPQIYEDKGSFGVVDEDMEIELARKGNGAQSTEID